MSLFGKKKTKIGERQRKKITADFNIFFDTKRSGKLTWDDIEQLQSHVLTVSGWQSGSAWWQTCQEFFKEVWQTLLSLSATKNAQHVTAEEWVEAWASVTKDKQDFDKKSAKATKSSKKSAKPTETTQTSKKDSAKASESAAPEKPAENGTAAGGAEIPPREGDPAADVDAAEPEMTVELPEYFPSWVGKYFEYKFRLFDRSGDGCIDVEEFEYVLWDGFNVSPTDCREAFAIISQDGEKTVDRRYFLEMFVQYFLSDDVASVGNHLNGKLAK